MKSSNTGVRKINVSNNFLGSRSMGVVMGSIMMDKVN